MFYIAITFIISFVLSLIFIRFNLFCDFQEGVQKFHKRPTPRVGGLAIYFGLWSLAFVFFVFRKAFSWDYFFLLVSTLPVFMGGLMEDITKNVSPRWRLIAGFVSGVIAFFLVSAQVRRIDIPFIDYLLSSTWFSLLFSSFAFAGVSHAFNIIDGFNGLASGVAMIVFGAYAYVSFLHRDYFLLYVSLGVIFATLGFFLWNYPFGLIFLGDGGAYLLGFMAAVVGAMLVNRYQDISSWFPFLLVLYPVWETVFSMYRRKFLRKRSPFLPDALHFHSLVYKRLTKFFFGPNLEDFKRNSYTSSFLWIMEFLCFLPAVVFWNSTILLVLFSLLFVTFYTWLYFRIVKFKTPGIFKTDRDIY
ncbi:MAG: MraY family glycosyltransferase [Thermosulfidibacteraceae bacterium]|jgi:UDP-N-acetylmuramyl pentapeptide phosphotransferase/UDP-N-acetylglucosamine-1-phosphate transferase